jgi:uncharacterized protein (DUF433 family)
MLMAMPPARSYPYISAQPQVMSGRPCIAGTRVRVMDIVSARQAGVPDEELREYFSSRPFTLSEIHAALTYYYDHQDEIDAALAEGAQLGRQAGIGEHEKERRHRAGYERHPVQPDELGDWEAG